MSYKKKKVLWSIENPVYPAYKQPNALTDCKCDTITDPS